MTREMFSEKQIRFLNDVTTSKDYTIDELTGLVNVNGDVKIDRNAFQMFGVPVSFGTISGHFKLKDLNATSLEGIMPKEVRGSISIDELSNLTSLKYMPDVIHSTVTIENTPSLSSIDWFPNKVETGHSLFIDVSGIRKDNLSLSFISELMGIADSGLQLFVNINLRELRERMIGREICKLL